MRGLFVAALLFAAPALAKTPPPAICPGPVDPVLFIAPMGEPFRPQPDGGDPVRRWFDGADRDHDGRLTIAELMLDADRFFATLDKDHDGELLPDEVSAYEENVAPEVRIYQPRRVGLMNDAEAKRDRKETEERQRMLRKRRKGDAGYDGTIGAGRYAFLNIPNPVATADADMNRAIDRAEFRAAAADRFRDLDPNQTKALTFAALPRTPAQVAANQRCLDRIEISRQTAPGRARHKPEPAS
jgi:Ca2+-binding EF-hand superfamily protein